MRDEAYLPSLLDRLSDDAHLDHMRKVCQTEIGVLESKLGNEKDAVEDTRRQWQEQLRQKRQQYQTLRDTTGSLQAIKDCVKRDLAWLLNSRNLCVDDLEKRYPQVARSVLNFGMPDLTGKTVSSLERSRLEKTLEKTIQLFEPRILKNTLKVRLLVDESAFNHNALMFEIVGELWADPIPLHLQLTTQLNLETGDVEILE